MDAVVSRLSVSRGGRWRAATLAFDTGTPAAQEAFYYLITTRNICGEGPASRDSSGALLPLTSPCP